MTEKINQLLESLDLAQEYENEEYDQLATDIRLSVIDQIKNLDEADRKTLIDSLKSEK